MATKQTGAQNPLILRCNRLMEAFAKSDDERDFYLDRQEGFIIYADLDKSEEELQVLEKELKKNSDRYCLVPKLTFYETKKIMEGFINEKVYDIDTKEKLLDIVQSKEAREHFLEFIYDHHSEWEKWQTFYQERSRIRIIEWLRGNNYHFVFEEDLDLPRTTLEKLKKELFQIKVSKDVADARKVLFNKAKTYYSNEALNPRPKRGRPPKQILKTEIEPQITTDIYTTVPNGLLGFLFIPDMTGGGAGTFSSKFGHEGDIFAHRRPSSEAELSLETLNTKLQELRTISSKWKSPDNEKKDLNLKKKTASHFEDEDEDDFDDEEEELEKPVRKNTSSPLINGKTVKQPPTVSYSSKAKPESKKPVPKPPVSAAITKKNQPAKQMEKKPIPFKSTKPAQNGKPGSKPPAKAKGKPQPKSKSAPSKKKTALRPMLKLKKKSR